MTYYSLGDQLFNATMLSLLFGLLGSVCGMFWPMFRSVLLSIGMLMIFFLHGWIGSTLMVAIPAISPSRKTSTCDGPRLTKTSFGRVWAKT